MASRNKKSNTDAATVAVVEDVPVAVKAEKKAKPTVACGCGCGTQVPRRFAPGHDGRLKGRLIAEIKANRLLGLDDSDPIAELTTLGWERFIPEAK